MDPITKTEVAIKKFSEKELGNIKVLMIEDDIYLTDIVLTKLSQHGCIPYMTGNGLEALGLAERYLPDVIILDLMLPGLSGEEILKQLKTTAELKDIPVIVFSNKSGESDIKSNLDAGASKYLVKSATDFNVLIDVVKELVSKV